MTSTKLVKKCLETSNVSMIPPTSATREESDIPGGGGHVQGQILLSSSTCLRPRGARPERVTAGMNHTGRQYPRQLTSVKNWCSANAGRDVWSDAIAKRLNIRARHCVHVRESVDNFNTLEHYFGCGSLLSVILCYTVYHGVFHLKKVLCKPGRLLHPCLRKCVNLYRPNFVCANFVMGQHIVISLVSIAILDHKKYMLSTWNFCFICM